MSETSSSAAGSPSAFKVGFIGAGGIAVHQMNHLKKLGGVEIACAADVSEKSLAGAKELHSIGNTYADYREMLRKETAIDAVSVCTPNALHAENTIAALEAGKHVMVEKPMAMHAREAQKMLDAAKRSGKQLIIGFQWRLSLLSFRS